MRIAGFLLWVLLSLAQYAEAVNYLLVETGQRPTGSTGGMRLLHEVEELNQLDLDPGDTVFLQRGGKWTGTLLLDSLDAGLPGKPVVILPTGVGPIPEFTGYRTFNPTASLGARSISVELDADTAYLLRCKGVRKFPARTPDKGWRILRGQADREGIRDKALDSLWQRSTIRMRSVHWAYEARQLDTIRDGKVFFGNKTEYAIPTGWGYFLEGWQHLDYPGEWALQPGTRILHWIPDSSERTGVEVQVCVIENGIRLAHGIHDIVLQAIRLNGYGVAGVRFDRSARNVQLVGLELTDIGQVGIHALGHDTLPGFDAITIRECSIRDCDGIGIGFGHAHAVQLLDNSLHRIGLHAGYGWSGTNGLTGILIERGSENVIDGNRLDSIGYNGIRIDGRYNRIAHNAVEWAMLRCSDGAAYYACGSPSFGSAWVQNYCSRVIGSNEGVPADYANNASGIYLDNDVSHMVVEGNIIDQVATYGIHNNWGAHDQIIRDNTIYQPGVAGLSINPGWNPGATGRLHVRHNTIFISGSWASVIRIPQFDARGFVPFVSLDSNYYINATNVVLVNVPDTAGVYQIGWMDWQEKVGMEKHSVVMENLVEGCREKMSTGTVLFDSQKTSRGWQLDPRSKELQISIEGEVVIPPSDSVIQIRRSMRLNRTATDPVLQLELNGEGDRTVSIGWRATGSRSPGKWVLRRNWLARSGTTWVWNISSSENLHKGMWLSLSFEPDDHPFLIHRLLLRQLTCPDLEDDAIRKKYPLIVNRSPDPLVMPEDHQIGLAGKGMEIPPYSGAILER